MLPTIIKAIEGVVDIPVRPYGIDNIEEAICYTYDPQTDDGAVATARLEIRIITRDIAKAERLRKSIISALVTVADNPKNGYNSCRLNGGGNLWDDEIKMTHTILYFNIIMKSEVNHNG